MISKLQTECGYQFTCKLEGMFQDMRISAETMEAFKNYVASLEPGALGGVELNVHVLTTGFWPTQPATKCILPQEVTQCCEVFKKYYLERHSGRRLTWQTNMGTAELRAQFGPKKHELLVSTYQMCILMLFNQSSTLSFKDIQKSTEIPIPDLKRNLTTLSSARYRILLRKKASESGAGGMFLLVSTLVLYTLLKLNSNRGRR